MQNTLQISGVKNGGFPFEIAKTIGYRLVIIIIKDWPKYDMSNRCALRLSTLIYIKSTLSDLILGQSTLPERLGGTRDWCVVYFVELSLIPPPPPPYIYQDNKGRRIRGGGGGAKGVSLPISSHYPTDSSNNLTK